MADVTGTPKVIISPPVRPANMLATVVQSHAWCLVTYRSGRQEPMAVTGTVVLTDQCSAALREAKIANFSTAIVANFAQVVRFAEQGFIKKSNHRGRPIVGLKWIDPASIFLGFPLGV
jgi:hypothetical protein